MMWIILFVLIVLVLTLSLYLTCYICSWRRQDTSQVNICSWGRQDTSQVKVVVIETDQENKRFKTLVETLNKWSFNYVLLGKGEIWKGFGTKAKILREYLQKVIFCPLYEDTIIVCIDGRDTFANGTPQQLVNFYNLHGENKIIFGSEKACCTSGITNEEKKWMKARNSTKTKFSFLNSGLFMGKIKDVLRMLDALNIKEHEDDQTMITKYWVAHPDSILLDYHQEIFSNSHAWCMDGWCNNEKGCFFEFDENSGRYKNTITNSYPVIIHTPAKHFYCYDKLTMLNKDEKENAEMLEHELIANKEENKKIHDTLYDMLQTILSLLQKKKITYWATGGTLLGAIRHQGIIPWDDDVDLTIPKKEFSKLFDLNKELETSKYKIIPFFFGAKMRCKSHTKEKKTPDIDFFTMHEPISSKPYFFCEGWPHDVFYIKDLFPLKLYPFGHLFILGPNHPYTYLHKKYGENCKEIGIVDTSHGRIKIDKKMKGKKVRLNQALRFFSYN